MMYGFLCVASLLLLVYLLTVLLTDMRIAVCRLHLAILERRRERLMRKR